MSKLLVLSLLNVIQQMISGSTDGHVANINECHRARGKPMQECFGQNSPRCIRMRGLFAVRTSRWMHRSFFFSMCWLFSPRPQFKVCETIKRMKMRRNKCFRGQADVMACESESRGFESSLRRSASPPFSPLLVTNVFLKIYANYFFINKGSKR